MDPMVAIKETFFQECEEQLSEIESGLLRIDNGDDDQELINGVFRAVHSIKGGASAFGFDDLVEFVHLFETTLDLLRSRRLTPTQAVVDLLLRASDILVDLVQTVRQGGAVDKAALMGTSGELSALCENSGAGPGDADESGFDGVDFTPLAVSFGAIFEEDNAEKAARRAFEIKFRPFPSLYANANESLWLLRLLTDLGDAIVECDTDEVPYLAELDPEGAYFAWTVRLETQASEAAIREIFEFVESDCELSVSTIDCDSRKQKIEKEVAPTPAASSAITPSDSDAPPAQACGEPSRLSKSSYAESGQRKPEQSSAPQQTTIRVDLDKVDRMINLVGELVINQAVLSQRVSEAGLSRASPVMIGLDELAQLTRDIQDSVMAIRAQPVQPVFQRMSRVVREVAALAKKSVRLVTEGERTEVDKTVIERLTDPLTHMIRNAVDHGVESPEARLAAGKPEEGVLRLSAMHRSGRIIIELADNGAGIDRDRVKEKAIANGLISADATLSDDEIDALIFLPGFSTVDAASAISGRGVGMDVVKKAIQALGGRISISSQAGKGCVFSMSLPLTLAVLDGMVVTVAGQIFVVPLSVIIETLQPRPDIVRTLGGGVRVLKNRDSFVPVIDLANVLGCQGARSESPTQVALLTETESGAKCALLVDAIQGQQQIVIKSLETNYGRVRGVSAATILGDGRVALIIDVEGVINAVRADGLISEASPAAAR